jgi:5-methylcytosine-specific restriction endonuclease McrA
MMVDYKGGKCVCCGYDKYIGALDFHHINPNDKVYRLSVLRNFSLESLKDELDKCVLLCRNCHAEVHAGVRQIPI